jgi:hypothetical protein
LAQHINGWIEMTSFEPQFVVHGVIRNQDSAPRPGLTVKAFDRNVGMDDTLLGQTVTDDRGYYSITYTAEQLGDKAAADMVISVYQGNNLLQTSDVIFNMGKVGTRDFVVPEVNPIFNKLRDLIQSLLRYADLGKLSRTQTDFLNKKK